MKDTQQVDNTEQVMKDEEHLMSWFDTLMDAMFKVIVIIFCSFIAGVGFAFGSKWSVIIYDAFVEWAKTQ